MVHFSIQIGLVTDYNRYCIHEAVS